MRSASRRAHGGPRRPRIRRLHARIWLAVRRPWPSASAAALTASARSRCRSSSAPAKTTPSWRNCWRRVSDCRNGGSPTPAPRRRWMRFALRAASPDGIASSRSKAATTGTMIRRPRVYQAGRSNAAGPAAAATPGGRDIGLAARVLDDIAWCPSTIPRRSRARSRAARRRLLHRRTGDGEHRHLPARARISRGGSRDHAASIGTLLLFDEVKTGITASWHGAGRSYGVLPDLIAVGKSIGGGVPLGAFGGTEECMDAITTGTVLHVGTFNGNPLCMAAARAVLEEICTPEETARVIARQHRFVADCQAPAGRRRTAGARRSMRRERMRHLVGRHRSGITAITLRPISISRSRSGSGASIAACLLPPGLDEQWLLSVAHTSADLERALEVLRSFVDAMVQGISPAL